ncbi:hypothetical protein GCM10027569_78420 [Flindersiella endophytica]
MPLLLVGDLFPIHPDRDVLAEFGFDVFRVTDKRSFAGALDEMSFGLAIVGHTGEAGGPDACRAIRSHPRHSGIYVLMVLESPLGEQIGSAFRAGADDFVTRALGLPGLEARLTAGVRNARLLQSEARLRALIANVPGAIYRCANDAAWTMNLISDEIQRISGYPAEEFVDSRVRTFTSIIHPDDRGQVERGVRAATAESRQFVLEYRIVRKDGTIAWVLERGQQVLDGTGQAWLEGVIFDVSDRRQADEQLRESERRLAVAQDRERIARALHDGVIQVLFGVGTLLRNADVEPGQSEAARSCLATSIDRIDSVIKDLRGYVMELRPGLLADRQLHDALAMVTAEFEAESGIVVAIDIDAAAAAQLTPYAEDVLLMVREALSNVRRHAGASTCRVSLKPAAGGVTLLEIDDDGHGFDPAQPNQRGQGLRNLAERAEHVGGRLNIVSGPNGTMLQARLQP